MSTCFGSGSWTMKPVHSGSSLSSRTFAAISSWVAVSGSSTWIDEIPTSAQSRCLPATYARLPGSSPTRIVPSPGTTPCSASFATRTFNSSLIAAAVALPSRICAVTPPESAMRRQSGDRQAITIGARPGAHAGHPTELCSCDGLAVRQLTSSYAVVLPTVVAVKLAATQDWIWPAAEESPPPLWPPEM